MSGKFSGFFSLGLRGLFGRLFVFLMVFLVIFSVFVLPFYFFEVSVNNDYYKVVSFSGVYRDDLDRVRGVDGVFFVFGLRSQRISLNGSEVYVVFCGEGSGVFMESYIVSGGLPSSSGEVLVSESLHLSVGDLFSFNGSSYRVSGVIYSSFSVEVLDYPYVVPVIVFFDDPGKYNLVFVFADIFRDSESLKQDLKNVFEGEVAVSEVNLLPGFRRLTVVSTFVSSFVATFLVAFLFFNVYRREFAVLLGVGWKRKHLVKLFYYRYITVYVLGYVLSVLFLAVLLSTFLKMYFFFTAYLLLPFPTLLLNLVFLYLVIIWFSNDFVEVLNG